MKRTIIKYILRTILIIAVVIILLPMLLYIPFVQQGLANFATRVASEQLGMQIELEKVRIRFPLDIELQNALVITSEKDTLLQCKALVLDLGFKKILDKEIEVEELSFEKTKFHYVDSAKTLDLRFDVEKFNLMARPVSLGSERAVLPDVSLTGGDVSLHLVSTPEDTTKTESSFNWAFEVENVYLKDIRYVMTTSPNKTYLESEIDDAHLNKAVVDIGKQDVALSKAKIDGALCKFLTAPPIEENKEEDSSSEEESLPWTINLDTLSLARSNVTYGKLDYLPVEYFDPSYISIYDLNIEADEIYNRGADVKADVNHISFFERSGISLSHANLKASMDSSKISVSNLYMATQNSTIKGSLIADKSVLEQNPNATVNINMGLSLSVLDAPYFIPSISDNLPIAPTSKIDGNIEVGGSLSVLHLKEFSLSQSDNFYIKATGDVSNIINDNPLKLRADIQGELLNGEIAQFYVGDKDSSAIAIPNNISLNGKVSMSGDTIRSNVGLYVAGGSLNAKAYLNLSNENYRLNLSVNKLPTAKFLKNSSLGDITTSLSVRGEKFNPLQEGARANMLLSVDTLLYNNYLYSGININLRLSDGKYKGAIVSDCKDLKTSLDFNGRLSEQKQTIALKGDITNIDLQQLKLSDDRLGLSSSVDISASIDTVGIYSLKGGLGTTTVRMYGAKRTLPGLKMDIFADTTKIDASIEAKGLFFDFNTPVSLNKFIAGFDTVMVEAKNQSDSIKYDIERIKNILPPFNLSFCLDNNPIVSALFKRNGMAIGLTKIDISAEHNKPLYLKSRINSLSSGEMLIDSICFDINQNKKALQYDFSVNGVKDGEINGGAIKLYGSAYDNILTVNCIQTDANKQKGFDLGGELAMLPELLKFSLTSPKPIMGYREFTVNDSNYISYDSKGKIAADLKLLSGEKEISLQSKNDSTRNFILLKLQQLDIASMLKLWPLAPSVEGVLFADLGINLSANRFGARGSVGVESLIYEGGKIGDLNLKAGFRTLQEGGEQVMVSLNLNDRDVARLGGKYQPGTAEPMKLKLTIDSLPLLSLNPFIKDLATLSGALNGEFSLLGKEDDIKMNGFLQFADTDIKVHDIGTTFTLSPEQITMKDNVITMYNFGLSGPNKRPMYAEGTIKLGKISDINFDFGNIVSDILITASNFQLVDVKRNNKTLVYGKAFSDMFMVIQGPMNDLDINGNVALLNGTELTYTLRDESLIQQEDVSDLVTFTAFTDTLNTDEVEVKHKPHWGVDMMVEVSIGKAVKLAINLSPDAKSGVEIQGGGELLYTMNMLGDTQFTGRYNITSGMVKYTLPVVSTMIFTIDDRSYVEWNGEMLDPMLNITAQNKVRASVNQGGTSNLVNFYVIIALRNTLDNLDVSFNLSAPENMTISNELASMSEDQRSEQALSMLLYNSYTGASSTESNFDMNSALGTFISQELNQWANRTLKNVDLTFGVDSYTSAEGESSLDYSYEFSKSLLNDRLRVAVGGSYNPDLSPSEVAQSILGDVSLEYQLDSRDNMLLRIFRASTNDILEGNISEYGVGFAVRKQVLKLKELFQITGRKEKVAEKKSNKAKEKEEKRKEKEEDVQPSEKQTIQSEDEKY